MEESAKYFRENHYLKVEQVISKEEASYFYDYVKLAAKRLCVLEERQPVLTEFDNNTFGTFEDTQAPGDYSKYGDLAFDTLLARKLPLMEVMTGLELIPTYSYHRLYTTGTELKRHKDRPSCEISTTLCLGYDTSNLDDKNWNWPMFVGPNSGEEGTEGEAIYMKPGDMIIYRGCNLEHWREPYTGINHAQVFLHYNTKDSNNNMLFDTRPTLGLPACYGTNKK
tara:strand:- start:789 stop:1460 length:672 start_codon:yes stop_codon:yes gene_type:complete